MEQIISSVGEFIRSDLLIFIVLGTILLLTALLSLLRLRDFVGYVLGWFIGIFVIAVYRIVGGDLGPDVSSAVDPDAVLTVGDIIIPTVLGLAFGFGLLFLLSLLGGSRATWAGAIAIFTAAAVLTIYFLAISPAFTRKLVSIFALAFTMGALLHVVLRGAPARRIVRRTTVVDRERARAVNGTRRRAAPVRQARVQQVRQQTEVRQTGQ